MAIPRSHLPPLHTRNLSSITVESDSSDTSANPMDDDDTDYFVAHANDSQSSLGAITVIRDCDPDVDMELTHRMTPISKLPPEILIAILTKLTTTADLKNCMLVSYAWAIYAVGILWHRPLCNKWSNLANVVSALGRGEKAYFQYHEMVKRLNLSAISDKINDGTVQPFMNCKGIERLTLTNCSKLTDWGVAGLIEGCRKLQALDVTDLESLTDRTLHTLAQNCAKLQGLNITNCSSVTDESLAEVAEHCRQLKRLKLNNVYKITDTSVTAVARNCRSILEIDLAGCTAISSVSVTALLSNLAHLRELRLAHCLEITDTAFTNLAPHLTFEALRILDLTACEQVRDDAIARLIPAAPRLRNLVLAKCRHITDRAVTSICKLTKNLHYIHLGHCVNLTDNAVIQLVKACNRIRYIDLACCSRLTDASVRHLAQLPKLRRIGLVKCQALTDASIIALAHGPLLVSSSGKIGMPSQFVSLERVHLSYCLNLTLKGITALLHNCPRLTHLSLTGVQAFLREDLTRFCRDAPPEFTHPQRDVFCVFSGEGVQRLREYLMRQAMESAERENQIVDDALLDGVDSPGVDTMSDDGTIDGNDQTFDPRIYQQQFPPLGVNLFDPRARPRPRSLHELPSYHVEMPLYGDENFQRYGAWTPNISRTPERSASIGPPHLNLMSSSQVTPALNGFDQRSQSPGPAMGLDFGPGSQHATPSASQLPSRRHTLIESSNGYFDSTSLQSSYAVPPRAPELFPDSRQGFAPPPNAFNPSVNTRPSSSHLWNLGMRSASDVRQTYLRPETDYSTFDANHEAIMATIPGSRSASRHASRSTSPHPSRVNSRSRLGNLLGNRRQSYQAAPFSYAEAANRGVGSSQSRERTRMEEEEHRQIMLRALAEADTATQLGPSSRPVSRRGEPEPQLELPLLHPDLIEHIPASPVTPQEASDMRYIIRGPPPREEDQDVTMTQ